MTLRNVIPLCLAACLLMPALAAQAAEPKPVVLMDEARKAGRLYPSNDAGQMEDMLGSQFGKPIRFSEIKDKDAQDHIAAISRFVVAGNIVSAKLLIDEVKAGQRYQSGAYQATPIEQIAAFIQEASNPPADDQSFQEAIRIYKRELSRYKAWPQDYRRYVDAMLLASVYDDEVAYQYASQRIGGKPDNGRRAEESAAVVKSMMKSLRQKADKEDGHAH